MNNLIPSKASKRDFTGLGSEVELDFHIENAALKYFSHANISPLGLLLTGVSLDPCGPATLVSDGKMALKRLPSYQRELLSQKLYTLKVPMRWRPFLKNVEKVEQVAVIKEDGEFPDLAVAFYGDIVSTEDKEAQNALDCFYKAIKANALKLEVRPGRLIYINNHYGLHSRESFNPSFDRDNRAKRWIQRTFIAPDLWNLRHFTRKKHRIFIPKKQAR